MWVYDGFLSLNMSRARCSLFTKHSYHHLHDDRGISSFKSIVAVLVFTPSVTHDSLTQRAERRFGLVSLKLFSIWSGHQNLQWWWCYWQSWRRCLWWRRGRSWWWWSRQGRARCLSAREPGNIASGETMSRWPDWPPRFLMPHNHFAAILLWPYSDQRQDLVWWGWGRGLVASDWSGLGQPGPIRGRHLRPPHRRGQPRPQGPLVSCAHWPGEDKSGLAWIYPPGFYPCGFIRINPPNFIHFYPEKIKNKGKMLKE